MSLPSVTVRAADVIHRAFDDFHLRFRAITRRTKDRFEHGDFVGIRQDTVARVNLQGSCVEEALASLRSQLGSRIVDRELWPGFKDSYTNAILGRHDFELAQSFFNSLTRKVFPHSGVDPRIDYVAEDFPLPYWGWEMASARMYAVRRIDAAVVARLLEDADFRAKFKDLEADAELAAERIEAGIEATWGSPEIEAVDMLRPIFIRNKAAYLVGRARRGKKLLPIILAVLNGDSGLEIDAVLTSEADASILFSFARWYFHADVESPREVIGFLHSIMPLKRIAELYISLGYHKHGKTELFKDLLHCIAQTDELFTFAPGKPGLVMVVFTLPSYPFVFKVIKDSFPQQKRTTKRQVREKYRDVLLHDRVGRLVDFQEFEHLRFPRLRFDPELLDQLLAEAGATVNCQDSDVVITHLYIGRRVTPLDLYLQEAPHDEQMAAVLDLGAALKELAAANIFPGDILLKNFGVTRHGRVVSYDYDELEPLTSCTFRRKPVSRSYEDEMAAEPWFSIADDDIFPDELRTFMGLRGEARKLFEREHGDLYGIEIWREMQRRNQQDDLIDFFPYPCQRRLRPEGRLETPVVAG